MKGSGERSLGIRTSCGQAAICHKAEPSEYDLVITQQMYSLLSKNFCAISHLALEYSLQDIGSQEMLEQYIEDRGYRLVRLTLLQRHADET